MGSKSIGLKIPKAIYRVGQSPRLRWTPVPSGAQVRQSLGTTDLAEAIQEAARIRRMDGPAKREAADACDAEVDVYVAAEIRRGLSRATMESRGYVLHVFVKAISASFPRLISQRMIQQWYDATAKVNAYTAEVYLNQVKWWMAWLVEKGKLTRNLAAEIRASILLRVASGCSYIQSRCAGILGARSDPELEFAI